MIPSIEQICEDLAAGRISIQQAIEWLYEHMRVTDLRDTFAAAALQGALCSQATLSIAGEQAKTPEHYAEIAYGIADAMLAERANV